VLHLGGELSLYVTAHISRFGLYATDALRLRPDDFDPALDRWHVGFAPLVAGAYVRGITQSIFARSRPVWSRPYA
jgi:hypothetical protein